MNASLYVGLAHWTRQNLELLAQPAGRIQGIILGDPFCPQRMFDHNDFDIPLLAAQAKSANCQVAYQTPVYLTSRNYIDTLQVVRLLHETGCLDLLLVQDIGFLIQLMQEDLNVPLCWSYWATKRNDLLSRDFLDLLLQSGITYFETSKPKRIPDLQKYGFKVNYRLYAPSVVSFGRVCYNRYFSDAPCKPASQCSEDLSMVSNDGKIKYQVDGHTITFQKALARPIPENSPDCASILVRDRDELAKVLERYAL